MHNKSFEGIDKNKMQKLIDIKSDFLSQKITRDEAKKMILENYQSITPEEFAYTEQVLKDLGFDDDTVHDKMEDLLDLLDGIMQKPALDLPLGHPIRTYQEENIAIQKVLEQMDGLMMQPFDKESWTKFYDKIYLFNNHLSRKQNQLFPKLEEKGFDRPSKIMWSFDNEVKKSISTAKTLLEENKEQDFLALQSHVREVILDIIDKEESVLFPTSVKLLSHDEFVQMRQGDDEIGYCLISNPPAFGEVSSNPSATSGFAQELYQLMSKYQIAGNEVLDVKQGKLTLEQINLIFQHLPVDLSYVDENELVKFYSDTAHRVFPRSPNVIGRDVKNCHPRESLDTVNEIIETFRQGKQHQAEFWLELGGKFIYILYVAVRDEQGKFRGVLEMMQDATHIRSLEGSRRLLSWDNSASDEPKEQSANDFGFTKDTLIADIIKKHPYIREFMPSISPVYQKLLNPEAFATIGQVATLEMVALRGNFEVTELIQKITDKIKLEEK